ncbi:deleted in malignant brain tumors 1 protein-like [Liolophura sinensis]|uniref:deleted in malignant brain tumors 1 protein-like n=1 Tax=Liolophura sinensis TaxID=3198878 RepID=UPI0031583D41
MAKNKLIAKPIPQYQPAGSKMGKHSNIRRLMGAYLEQSHRETPFKLFSETYSVRLVNGQETNSSLSGRLEVFYKGVWGTVCDDSVNNRTGNTLCRFLGFSGGYHVPRGGFGAGTGTIWLDDLVCSGNETSISQCSHQPWGNNNCAHNEDLGLVCSNVTSQTYSVRLVNGQETNSSLSGRLEVFYNGVWGTVCDDSVNNRTGNTLCRFLGFSVGYHVPRARFGSGTGTIWLDDLVCSGNETSISQCSHRPWGINNCAHKEDLGLVCSKVTSRTPLRLVNGTQRANSLSGRLEVFHDNNWGTVCDDSFSAREARVVCSILEYSQGVELTSAYFGQGNGTIWLDDVRCLGNESDISLCYNRGWGRHNCNHREDVGVACFNTTAVETAKASFVVFTEEELDQYEQMSTRLVAGHRGDGWQTGRLEISFAGEWGTVCNNQFNNVSATVACRTLGYRYGNYLPYYYPNFGTGRIWLGGAVCRGNEADIAQCEHDGLGNHFCGHSWDVGIICSNNKTVCEPTQFRCDDGRCLPITFRCDGTITCRGGEDERGCMEMSGRRVTVNTNGELWTVCSGPSMSNNRKLAESMCVYMGHSGLTNVSVERTQNLPLGMVFYPTPSFAGYLGEFRPYVSIFCAPLNIQCSRQEV